MVDCHSMDLVELIEPSWEAYWYIGIKAGYKGQTLFKLEQMHKELGGPSHSNCELRVQNL